jgi:hypothetical protein
MSAPPGDHDDERDRTVTNIFLIVMFVAVVGGGYWLADALLKARDADNCMAAGGRGCGRERIEVPSR